MTPIDDGLVDSPFGRVTPEILDILNGGSGNPQAAPVAAPVATPTPTLTDVPQASPVSPQGVEVAPEQSGLSQLPREPVDPNSFSSALGRGTDQLQANFGGTLEAFGEIIGSDTVASAGADIRKEQLAQAAEYGEPSVSSYTGVNTVDDALNYGINTVGGIIPSLGTTLAGMGAGAKAGAAFGVPGRVAGPMIGAFLTSMGINTGALQNEIKEYDPNAKEPWVSFAFGAGAGALDAVGLKALVSPILKWASPQTVYQNAVASGFPKVMAAEAVKSALAETAKGAAIEGGISAVQDSTQAFLAAKVTDHEISADKILERAGNAFIGGALGGGAIRGGADILDTVMHNAHAANTAASPSQGFSSGAKEEGGLLTKIWQMGGREATAPLEPLARVSPAAESFIREFRPDMTGEKATGKTVFETYELKAGKWNSAVNDVFHNTNDTQKAAIIQEASLPKAQITDPKARALRNIMDEAPAEGKAAGLTTGYIDGYMPFRPDADKIVENRAQFEADIAPYIQNPTQAVNEYLDTIANPRSNSVPDQTGRLVMNPNTGKWEATPTQALKGSPELLRGKVAQGSAAPKFSNLEFSRAFNDVPQSIMNRWAKEQTPKAQVEAIHDYMHGAAHRLAYVDKFGPNSEKANLAIAASVAEAEASGRRVSQAEVGQMYGLLDAYNGMYNRIQSDSLRNAQSIFSAFLTIKTLPLAALSSFVEITTPAIRGNIGDALMSAIPAMSQIAKDATATLFKGSPRSEWSKLAAEAGIDFATSQSILAERLGTTMFNRVAAGATRRFFFVNGLSALTHSQRTFAALTGRRIYNDAITRLAMGVDLTSAKGSQLATQLRTMGVDIKSRQDALDLYSPVNQSQKDAARQAEVLAIRRFTSQSILEPNAADLPLWMSDGRMQLLAQLKRYPTAYSNIILPQLARRMKPSYQGSYTGAAAGAVGTLFILGAMMQIGYIQDYMKRWVKAGFQPPEDTRTELQRFTDIASMNLLPMQLQYVTNMYAANRYGTDPVTANMGPAAGFLKEAATAGSRTIDSFQEDPNSGYIWQFMFNQVPFANQIKPLKEGVKESLDLP